MTLTNPIRYSQDSQIEGRARIKHALAVAILLLFMVCAGRAGHASVATQGTHDQGTHDQGIEIQGTHDQGIEIQGMPVQRAGLQATQPEQRGRKSWAPWLQSHRLFGLKARPDAPSPTLLEIVGFGGDTVHAFVRDVGDNWRYAELHPGDLAGTVWLEHRCDDGARCASVKYRIASVTRDVAKNTMPEYSDNKDIWLFEVEYSSSTTTEKNKWKNVCPGKKENARGMFVDGRWSRDGAWHPGGYTFSCVNGVIAKCARVWGYKPWKKLFTRDGKAISLRPLHQACMRAARADYCGDGISHTMDGTIIDMFDIYHFNTRDRNPYFTPEAGFTTRGARWVARKRWPTRTNDDTVVWNSFATCRRPKVTVDDPDEPALIHVWSGRLPLHVDATNQLGHRQLGD